MTLESLDPEHQRKDHGQQKGQSPELSESSRKPTKSPEAPSTPSPPSPLAGKLPPSPRGRMSPRGGQARKALGLGDLMSSPRGSSTSSSFGPTSKLRLGSGSSSSSRSSRTSSGSSSSKGRLQRPVKGSDSELLRMAVGNRQREQNNSSLTTSLTLAGGHCSAAALLPPTAACPRGREGQCPSFSFPEAMSEVLTFLEDLPRKEQNQPQGGKAGLALPLSEAHGEREATAKFPSVSSSPRAGRGRRGSVGEDSQAGSKGALCNEQCTVQERTKRRQRPHSVPAVTFDDAIESWFDGLPKANPIQHSRPRRGGSPTSQRGVVQGLPSPGKGRATLRGLRLQEFVLGVPYEDVHRHYVLEGTKLGQGQYGTVTRCTEIATGDAYACKTISKSRIRKPAHVANVQREVSCLNVLNGHPGFVSVRRVFEDNANVHMILELCEGGDLLDHILARGPLSEAEAARLCRFLMETLSLCHSRGIIHRDVKPENIMLAQAGSHSPFKLADFGLAVFSRDGGLRQDATGTPEYMAPEVFLKAYDARADIWSAGVVMYVALSNMPPFWASTKQSLKEAVMHDSVKFPEQRWGTTSRECRDLVFRMLDKNPETRLSASEVLSHPWIQAHAKSAEIPVVLKDFNITTFLC